MSIDKNISAKYGPFKVISILVFALSHINLSNQLNQCFYKYPRSYGDTGGDTDIRAFDIDLQGYIVTGGMSTSSNLKPSGYNAAMIAYYDPYGSMQWMYKLNDYNQKIKTMHMQKSTGRSPKALMVSQDQSDNRFHFYVFDLLILGTILSAFKDVPTTAYIFFTGYQANFYFDSTGYIYASMCTSNNNKFLFMKIDPQPTSVTNFSPAWSLTELTTSTSTAGIAVIKGTQANEFYFTSSFLTSSATIATMMIHRVNVATPSLTASYKYSITRASTINYADFSGIDVVEAVSGTQTIVGGGYFQYSSSSEFKAQMFKMEIDLTTGNVNNQFVITIPNMRKYQCMDSKYIDSTQFYTLNIEMSLQYDFILFRVYNINYGTSTASVTYQKITIYDSYWVYYGLILPSADALFSGSFYHSTTGGNEQAFFHISDVAKSCSTYEETPINTTLTNQAFSATPITKDTTNYITSASIQFTSIASTALISITQAYVTASLNRDIVFDCTNKQSYTPATISGTSTYTIPTQHLKQNGNFQFDLDTLFTGDSLCSDKSRIYTITAIAGNTNTYSITSGQYLYASQASLSAATDQILVSVVFVDGKTSTLTITITILDCSTSQITLPTALSAVTYSINGTAQTKNFNSYTKTKSYCQNPTISYSISPSITPSTAVQLDATTKVLTIYSTNLASVGVYTVSAIYTNPDNAANIYTFPFTLTVQCIATLTGTSTGLATNFTYYINSGTKTFDLNTLYSYSNNCGYSTSYAIQQTNGSSLPSFISIGSSTMIASCGEKLEYSLPEIKDDQINLVTTSFILNYARLYTQVVDSKKLVLSPTCDQKGLTSITITLKDSGSPPLSSTYKLSINVFDNRPVNYTQEYVENKFLKTITGQEYFDELPIQQQQLFLDFNATIIQIQFNGDVAIKVNQDLTFNESISLFDDCEIRVAFQSEYLEKTELLSWKILSYEERVINMNLEFRNPNEISINDQKQDIPIINIQKEDETSIKNLGLAMRVFLYMMIILSILFMFSRKKYNYMIWNMLCMLQLIIHLPLFDSNFPAVSLYFVKNIINPINLNLGSEIFKFFNLIPLLGRNFNDEWIDYFNRNYDIEPNEKYQSIGYDSIYGLVLLETFTILIAFGSIIKLVDWLFLKFIKSSNQCKVYQPQNIFLASTFRSLINEFSYNWFLRLCIQFYLQMCIVGYMILITYSDQQFNQRLIINIIVGATLFVFIKIFAFQSTYQMKTFKQKQSVQEFRKQYGSLFDDVDINCIICILVNLIAIVGHMIKDFIQNARSKVKEEQMMMSQTQVRFFETNRQNMETDQKEDKIEDISFSEYQIERPIGEKTYLGQQDRVQSSSTRFSRNQHSSMTSRVGSITRQFTRSFLTPKTVDHVQKSQKTVKIKGHTDRPNTNKANSKEHVQQKNVFGYPLKFDSDINLMFKNRFQAR
eukprot:403335631